MKKLRMELKRRCRGKIGQKQKTDKGATMILCVYYVKGEKDKIGVEHGPELQYGPDQLIDMVVMTVQAWAASLKEDRNRKYVN